MSRFEALFLVAGLLAILAYAAQRLREPRAGLLVGLFVIIPAYLSLERATQFLTFDETYIILEPLDLPHSPMAQWNQAALRTTDAVIGLLVLPLRLMPDLSFVRQAAIAKGLHWLLGIAALLWIHALAERRFVPTAGRALFLGGFLWLGLLLPTNALALKVFNYDLLGMLLAVVALLYLIDAVVQRRPRTAVASLVVATLAAQEKLIAAPVLLAAVAAYAYARRRPGRESPVAVMVSVLSGIALSVCVAGASWLVVFALRGGNLTDFSPAGLLDHLMAWTWPIVTFVLGLRLEYAGSGYSIQGVDESLQSLVTLARLATTVVVVCAVSFVMLKCDGAIRRRAAHLLPALRAVNLAFLPVALGLGVYGTVGVVAHIAPYVPIPPGSYHPAGQFNAATVHYGARSLPEHLFFSVAHSYAAFIGAIPSVLWIGLVAVCAAALVNRRRGAVVAPPNSALQPLLSGALLMPLVFGLGQLPTNGRYLNVGLFIFAFAVLVELAQLAPLLSHVGRASVAACAAALFLWEVLPFSPLYAPFRPFWAAFDPSFSAAPAVGRTGTVWSGWGEEIMLAGEELSRRCAEAPAGEGAAPSSPAPCQSLTLYSSYPGVWLRRQPQTRVVLMPFQGFPVPPAEYRYTDRDYYLLNRSSVAQRAQPFPADVPPEFVLQFRGVAQAWVFRGDRLRDAGFTF